MFCKFSKKFFHDWDKYKIFRHGPITDGDTGRVKGHYVIHQRFCNTCGEFQFKKTKIYL